MKKLLIGCLTVLMLMNIYGCKRQEVKQEEPKMETFQIATNSQITEADMRGYYSFACDLCNFVKEQFDILVVNYPERYSVLKDKLKEYEPLMTEIADENDDEELYIKGNYALQYGEELMTLVEESGLSEFVENDYNALIEKGIVKVDEPTGE